MAKSPINQTLIYHILAAILQAPQNVRSAIYGIRLMHQFPKLKEEIEMIIEAFNREVYGQIMIEQRSLSGISSALRRM